MRNVKDREVSPVQTNLTALMKLFNNTGALTESEIKSNMAEMERRMKGLWVGDLRTSMV